MNAMYCHLTVAIFETGAYRVPSKSQKSFICGGVRQTITLKSPGKGAPPLNPLLGATVTSLILDAVLKTKSFVPHWIFYFFLK